MNLDEAAALGLVFLAAGFLLRRLWKRLRPRPEGVRRQDLVQVSFGRKDVEGH